MLPKIPKYIPWSSKDGHQNIEDKRDEKNLKERYFAISKKIIKFNKDPKANAKDKTLLEGEISAYKRFFLNFEESKKRAQRHTKVQADRIKKYEEFYKKANYVFRRVAGKYYGSQGNFSGYGFTLSFNNRMLEDMYESQYSRTPSKIWTNMMRRLKQELKAIGQGVLERVEDDRNQNGVYIYTKSRVLNSMVDKYSY